MAAHNAYVTSEQCIWLCTDGFSVAEILRFAQNDTLYCLFHVSRAMHAGCFRGSIHRFGTYSPCSRMPPTNFSGEEPFGKRLLLPRMGSDP